MTRYLRCWRRVRRRSGRERRRGREKKKKHKERKEKKKNIPISSRRKHRFVDKEHPTPPIIAFQDRKLETLETTDTHPYNVVIHVVVPAVMFPAEDLGNVK